MQWIFLFYRFKDDAAAFLSSLTSSCLVNLEAYQASGASGGASWSVSPS